MKPPLYFENALVFRQWLVEHASSTAFLLVGYHKVGSGRPSMTWSESVDEALCFGWIDGVRKRIDDQAYSIRFTPRKTSSIWSAVNIAKFAQLQVQGRMTPSGESVYAHRTEARSVVYAYEQAVCAKLSDDELHTFQRNESAWVYFSHCPPGYKKQMLHWVCTAKQTKTRVNRLARLVEACSAGLRLR